MSRYEELLTAKVEEITELLEQFSRIQNEILTGLQQAQNLFRECDEACLKEGSPTPEQRERIALLEQNFERQIHYVLSLETALKNLSFEQFEAEEVDEDGQNAMLIFSELLTVFTLQIDAVTILIQTGEITLATGIQSETLQPRKEAFQKIYAELKKDFGSMKDFLREMAKDFQSLGDTTDFIS